MARGDLTIFNQFSQDVGRKAHNLHTDTLRVGIIDNTSPPTQTDVNPDWTDYSANQVATSAEYPDGGLTVANQDYSHVVNVATLKADGLNMAHNPSGFNNGHWAILYNDTAAGDQAIAFIQLRDDIGTPVSLQVGAININWNGLTGNQPIITLTI